MSEPPRPPESDVPTPPRGVRAPEQPVHQQATVPDGVPFGSPQPRTPAPRAPSTRPRGRTIALAVALVVGLVGTAWLSTGFLRENWLPEQAREPVVAEDGTGTIAGITVTLVELTDLGPDPRLADTDWAPPAGLHAWRVVLATESTNADIYTCDVVLVDDQGRRYRASDLVDAYLDGYELSYSCAADTALPQAALMVLVPADATIESVQIESTLLAPGYLELDVS